MFRTPAWIGSALLILPAAWALLRWAQTRRERVSAAIGNASTIGRIVSPTRRSMSVRLVAIGLLLSALAGPQFGIELIDQQGEGRLGAFKAVRLDVGREH